jgi:hypothetical protein
VLRSFPLGEGLRLAYALQAFGVRLQNPSTIGDPVRLILASVQDLIFYVHECPKRVDMPMSLSVPVLVRLLQAQPVNAAKLIPWVREHKSGPSRTIELPHFLHP